MAGDSITITGSGAIDVSGSGGSAGLDSSGGSGGGSGGMIKLHAPTIELLAGAAVVAIGGGGSSGADDVGGAGSGGDGSSLVPFGGIGPANGGDGFVGAMAAEMGQIGVPSSQNAGGGGGGGGGGLIETNVALQPSSTISAGAFTVVP
ncbi:MAG: hypothetical protein ACKV2T_06150 [Kofleriaceae bacterium]